MNIDLEPSEALIVLGALQDKQLAASRLAAISDGEEHEIADMAAKILRRVAGRLTDALYPDQCQWSDEWECDRTAVQNGLCQRHLDHTARIAAVMT